MEEKGKIESKILLLQTLVTNSFSDLLSDDTNETGDLVSCPVLPVMPHLWIRVRCDPQPHLGARQMVFATEPASADTLRLFNISGTTRSHQHPQQHSPTGEAAGHRYQT